MTQKYIHKWDDIRTAVRRAAVDLKGQYDCIIAIGTGGFVPAKLLKECLHIPCYSITIKSYSIEHQQLDQIEIQQWIDPKLIENQKVLLVDDMDDTGASIKFCLDRLKTGTNKIDVFVIDCKLKPKRYGERDFTYYVCWGRPADQWIVYLWES